MVSACRQFYLVLTLEVAPLGAGAKKVAARTILASEVTYPWGNFSAYIQVENN